MVTARKYPTLQEAILEALAEGPVDTLKLAKVVRRRPGNLELTLTRMERERLIVSDWIEGPRPRSRAYSLPTKKEGSE